MTRKRRIGIVFALALLVVLPACGGTTATQEDSTTTTSLEAVADASGRTTGSTALRLYGPTTAHIAPEAGADVVTRLDARTELGSTTTLLVVEAQGDWLEVLLPIRPNGTTGWVRTAAGELRTTDYRIDIDLPNRRVTLFDAGKVVLNAVAAIGAPDTPTPTGDFFVTDLVETGDPNGSYGDHAIGLSGHSNELTEFAGGDGQIGVHGTNQPSSIGQAVSHGCVRLANDVVAELVQQVPLGTPVSVR